ncbi:type II secretion system protein [Schlesneria paludicola]|uniref:type II secretion system protein n=1 Tax=Schlesneria paludicola TaxID=360056 RepID=UPI00029A021E|nr:prepilin-type N-terminal cleavage/methylation domain-containing protein [Schlesneria paludicola]
MVRVKPSTPTKTRKGFTLIELMIVIVILAVLAALLLPALGRARGSVRQAAVRAEITKLEGAINAFKARYGVEPPSRIVLYEDPSVAGAWNNSPNAEALDSLATLTQIWPEFNKALPRDWNGDGDMTDSRAELTQGECLVFFLGGIPNNGSGGVGFSPRGFSKDPANPAALGGSREGPFFEFDVQRLVDVGGQVGFPEYKDTFPGQRNPYLYFSSYDGAGYREQLSGVTYPEYGSTGPSIAYRQGALLISATFKSKSFQIISPGQDFTYGPGGPYVAGAQDPLPGWATSSTAPAGWVGPTLSFSSADRVSERDNITNFSNGVLAP